MPPGAATTSPARAPRPPDGRVGGAEDQPRKARRKPPPCAPDRNRCRRTARAAASSDLISPSGAPARCGTARNGARSSPAAPMKTGSSPDCGEVLGHGQEIVARARFSRAWRPRRESRRIRALAVGRVRGQFRARDLADRRAQVEHGAGQVFGGVDLALHAAEFPARAGCARCRRTAGGNGRNRRGSGRRRVPSSRRCACRRGN